jgi:dienelactone hydrolase
MATANSFHRARRSLGLLVLLAATQLPAAQAQSTFRVEVHPIVTQDVAPAQVLAGSLEGLDRTIAGELRLPFAGEVRVPAVVFLHGDAGALSNQPLWTDRFNAIGVAVLTLDSFSGRGHLSRTAGIAVDGALSGSLARTVDAYRALALLAQHPRIDARRIALMGVSSGARATIHAAMKRFGAPLAPPGVAFASFIALYPPCNIKLNGDTDLIGPLQIHHGAADSITRPEFCRAYVERLRVAGAVAQFFEYAAARHGYDGSPQMAPQRNPGAPNSSRCELEERDGQRLVNAATGEPLRPDDACMSRGIEGGPQAEAAAATREQVLGHVRRMFGLH